MVIEYDTIGSVVFLPLLGSVACGTPIFADENIEDIIPVPKSLIRRGCKYFLLRARGDSMDECGINDGDIVLVKQVSIAENGDKVVALINDNATIKKYVQRGNTVHLLPQSSNQIHQNIVVTDNLQIQGIVEANVSQEKIL